MIRVLQSVQETLFKPVTLEDVLTAAASVCDVSVAEMASTSRNRKLTRAQTVAAALVKRAPHLKLSNLG